MVHDIFQQVVPRTGSPLGKRLQDILEDYMKSWRRAQRGDMKENIKPLNLIVITDGQPCMSSYHYRVYKSY